MAMHKGLYSWPRHHQHTGGPQRPVFNAQDFAKDNKEEEMARNSGDGDMPHDEDVPQEQQREEEKHEKEKRKKKDKKSKKHRKSEEALRKADEGEIEAAATMKPNTKAKRDDGASQSANATAAAKLEKKRKRESDARPADASPVELTTADKTRTPSFVSGEDPKDLEATVAEVGAMFNQSINYDLEMTNKTDKKKKKNKDKSRLSDLTADAMELQTKMFLETKVPRNTHFGSEGSPQKKRKGSRAIVTDNVTKPSSDMAAPSVPKKTAIPLPPPATPVRASLKSQTGKHKDSRNASDILVSETPPSMQRMMQSSQSIPDSPISLPHVDIPESRLFGTAPTKAQIDASMSTPRDTVEKGCGRKAKPAPTMRSASKAAAAAGETVSSQPKADVKTPKPKSKSRKRAARSASVSSSVPSTTASSSSKSIIDLFNKAGKPYSRSGAANDPFITPDPKKADDRKETHPEAGYQDFTKNFKTTQLCVNFSNEQVYLNQYLDWRAENQSCEYPLPCLGAGSGCTTKRHEAIERHGQDETYFMQKAITASRSDLETLQEAVQCYEQAETLLRLAIRARVPMSIGRLSGTWTLYCPQYSANHVDRYGYGARMLHISKVSGFKNSETYMARLSIPPRSMPYTIMTFMVPPHASFRTTVLKTATEGYTMDVIFLGNGFMQLRVDLNLLLKGKPTELVGGKKVWMEFLGVHEKAVKWIEPKDELEEEGKKLFPKYGMGHNYS